MIPRYACTEVSAIWSDEHKLALWQNVEIAAVQARCFLGEIDKETCARICMTLRRKPIDIAWWKQRELEIKHDLAAFIEERRRFLSPDLQGQLHKHMTSYDTEESAFALMLKESLAVAYARWKALEDTLVAMALRYRYTVMVGRTHGQEAGLQSFGKRCLTWLQDLRIDIQYLELVAENLRYSKMSGIIGNYGGMSPELEREALALLGFKPHYGATQIMPREMYAPIAHALTQIVLTCDKIATAIRLGARSGRPIYQEPFAKTQKGSSAMPHKKNTVSTEQIEGMARLAKSCSDAIAENIKTWEERAIEQSCVERVAWPDLFHVTVHTLTTLRRVLDGLAVYPDNMLLEVIESRGCYASQDAKELLEELCAPRGITAEEAYRIVQLAAFNCFEADGNAKRLRAKPPQNPQECDEALFAAQKDASQKPLVSIQRILYNGSLKPSPELEATADEVNRWNRILKQTLSERENFRRWNEIFLPSYQLRNESTLYQKILGA